MPMRSFLPVCSIAVLLLAGLAGAQAPATEPTCPGPFEPSWESLSRYECPAWFRDAKFGIWAHWGPQCQPEMGDWYAQRMYKQGEAAYKFHVEKYGHPSEFGFKDVIHQWKADKFDPEKLIALYQRAGARYFVAMANHHDNFDAWNSKYQPWNSAAVGPKKDLIGMWAKAARGAGLPFGVTVHTARTWEWYSYAHGADKDGPKAGVPYDGRLTKADGRGKWWDGLDPADLYGPHGDARTKEARTAYDDKFLNRVLDLVTQHQPDLLYFDDGVLPLRASGERYGLTIAAHLYNTSVKAHGGKNQAVMNTKHIKGQQRQALVLDIERGKAAGIEEQPWQTDTCIGGWHYYRGIYDRKAYKTPTTVIHMLVDIVSKNGNLLLNIPVRGDGSIDEQEVAILEEMGRWMDINGESIYGTRPWRVYGEGPSTADTTQGPHGGMRDTGGRSSGSEDIRFTTKGNVLYAIALGMPKAEVTVKSLALPAGNVAGVSLLGSNAKLDWKQDAAGLRIKPADRWPCKHAVVFKVELAGPRAAK